MGRSIRRVTAVFVLSALLIALSPLQSSYADVEVSLEVSPNASGDASAGPGPGNGPGASHPGTGSSDPAPDAFQPGPGGGSGSPLPMTGSDVARLVSIALWLVVAGMAILSIRKKGPLVQHAEG